MKIKLQLRISACILAVMLPWVGPAAEVEEAVGAGEGVPVVRWELTPGGGWEDGGARRVALRVEVGCGVVAAEGSPANVVVVLDRSATMAGEKLEAARGAIAELAGRLGGGDRFGLVVYDDLVEVVRPAGPVARGEGLALALGQVEAGGGTAMFGGLAKGLAELRRHGGEGRVSRLILISDGRAGLGPGSISAMRELGRGAREEALSVTTIGLGLDYHEILLASLARESGGWHRMVEVAGELGEALMEELEDVRGVRFDPLWLGFEPGLGVELVGLGAMGGGGQLGEGSAGSEGERASLVALPPVGLGGRVAWVELELGEGIGDGLEDAAGLGDIVVWGQEVGGEVVEVRAEVKIARGMLGGAGEVKKDLLVELGRERALRRGQAAAYHEAAGEQDKARAEFQSNTIELLERAGELGAGELWEEAAASYQLSRQLEVGGAAWERNRKELQAVQGARVATGVGLREQGGLASVGRRGGAVSFGFAVVGEGGEDDGNGGQDRVQVGAAMVSEVAVVARRGADGNLGVAVVAAEPLVEADAVEAMDGAAAAAAVEVAVAEDLPAAVGEEMVLRALPGSVVAAQGVEEEMELGVPLADEPGPVAQADAGGLAEDEGAGGLERGLGRAMELAGEALEAGLDGAGAGGGVAGEAAPTAGEDAPMVRAGAELELAERSEKREGEWGFARDAVADQEEMSELAAEPSGDDLAVTRPARAAAATREGDVGRMRSQGGGAAGEVERLLGEAAEHGAKGDGAGARARYEGVLRLEPENEMALWGLGLLDALEAGELGGR
jgi:hypothetical protein